MSNTSADEAMEQLGNVQNIGFVDFTSDLVRNVYKIVVDSSMEQLKAYSQLVAEVSKPLIEYQKEVTGISSTDFDALNTEDKDSLDNYIEEVLGLTLGTGANVNLVDEDIEAMQSHFQNVTIAEGNNQVDLKAKITGTSAKKISKLDLQKFVLEKISQSASESYNMLVTILKLGMQKVEITNGLVETKLVFHIDSTDFTESRTYDIDSKSNKWGVQGSASARWGWGRANVSGGYNSSRVRVKVVNEKSTAAVNMSADIIGGVKINFRTSSFPSIDV